MVTNYQTAQNEKERKRLDEVSLDLFWSRKWHKWRVNSMKKINEVSVEVNDQSKKLLLIIIGIYNNILQP